MKKALFLCGGWAGHAPQEIGQLFSRELSKRQFSCQIADSLSPLDDLKNLSSFDLLFPFWTMGELSPERCRNLVEAVRAGIGLGGIHGGMGDAFRGVLDYEWMVGGHFVGHPYVGEYRVRICDSEHPITRGLPTAFPYYSEQYYLLVDPAVHVLADTEYIFEGKNIPMPVAWIRHWGTGRVFYSALGHAPEEFGKFPVALELTLRGLLWAAKALA